MSNKSKVKSTRGISEHRRQKSTAVNNLYLSSSLIGRFRKFVGKEQKSCHSRSTIRPGNTKVPVKNCVPNDARLASNLPKDAAVHFGTFYGVQGSNARKSYAGTVKSFVESTATYRKSTPRLEFTRQMVQKLERTAGTEEYARQVSALLEEIAEPAHFKLRSLSNENSIPDGKYSPSGYPLWYKDPYKMPLDSDEMYKLLGERFDSTEDKARDIFDEDCSDKNSWEELSEYGEEDGQRSFTETSIQNLLADEKSLLNLSATESSSVTEAKDTDSKEDN